MDRSVNDGNRFLIFTIDDRRYGLPLSAVERVVRAVEVTPLPETSAAVLGLVNVQGRIMPVVSLRALFGRPTREVDLSDRFIISSVSGQAVALVADQVEGVRAFPDEEVASAASILPDTGPVESVARDEGGLVLLVPGLAWLKEREARDER